jgi:hypothetical protein
MFLLASIMVVLSAIPVPKPAESFAKSNNLSTEAIPQRISEEQAAALALNEISTTPGGFQLNNPQHKVAFTPSGLVFSPRQGSPDWSWSFIFAGSDEVTLAKAGSVSPTHETNQVVQYQRGKLTAPVR